MQARHAKLGGCKVGAVPPQAKRRKVGRSAAKPLPPKVDLRSFLTKIEEQIGMSIWRNVIWAMRAMSVAYSSITTLVLSQIAKMTMMARV